ncbi:hypothetical protein, partial [Escherichia coli]|uniref:hypothetical protein n=1 Tax=Escherichia coli TaxID=562 RepID=UPI001F49998A
ADRNRSHWSTSKTPSYTKSVSWQHHPIPQKIYLMGKKKRSSSENRISYSIKLADEKYLP